MGAGAQLGDEPMDEEIYLIWSEEHGAWWNPNRAGYTKSMVRAGRYSREEAEAISNSANGHGRFCEVPVRVSLAIHYACQMPSGGR
jgi:hypothetical protein